ncbi:RNA polymerase sigma-70 factor (ECF subfamily) [Caulobacter ginsengisoli]|uniref:RNA polymerase sigma-70 factor (ECF subfamily) n=1 Tax=Caulobacter ginsengisoli TaxID=400775 RepID=A0ABU0IZL9_9CAUL|nr:RNA polymerase sigma factor [Caulobacter ginsengisoli]MDQ0466800.1 RNA polymerase sigma-70 factor (ECF subfamily) [Caulobacter ginsengisoli]
MDDIDDTTARALRTAWFRYLDTLEPLRAPLHAYCLRLTRDIWDAEDLVQDVLLKGFGMIGRGDLHGPGSPVANPRAYLFRCATHQWIDAQRRLARQRALPADPPPAPAPPPETARLGGEALFAVASPQARAAVILKDVFDFTLEEIADALRTTVGGVKSALRRGREALAEQAMTPQPSGRPGASPELVDRFVDAFRSRDVARLTAVLTETCSIEVPGVGGGRGRRGGWAEASVGHETHLRAAVYRGETVILFLDPEDRLYDVARLEEADGLVSRLIHHCFCPDTVQAIGGELGVETVSLGYHQQPETLVRMIATTTLPWGSEGLGAE